MKWQPTVAKMRSNFSCGPKTMPYCSLTYCSSPYGKTCAVYCTGTYCDSGVGPKKGGAKFTNLKVYDMKVVHYEVEEDGSKEEK